MLVAFPMRPSSKAGWQFFFKISGAGVALARAATGALAEMFEVQTVSDGVYALVGPKEPRSSRHKPPSMAIRHAGRHTPGDSFVRLSAKDTVFAGGIGYVERILGHDGQSNAKSWIDLFEARAALTPAHVVSGHGHAKTLEIATIDTYEYLVNLRTQIGALIEDSGDIMDAPMIDQSAFAYLEQFDSLARRSAQTTYEQMEWE